MGEYGKLFIEESANKVIPPAVKGVSTVGAAVGLNASASAPCVQLGVCAKVLALAQ